jgi:hypothetical protein
MPNPNAKPHLHPLPNSAASQQLPSNKNHNHEHSRPEPTRLGLPTRRNVQIKVRGKKPHEETDRKGDLRDLEEE